MSGLDSELEVGYVDKLPKTTRKSRTLPRYLSKKFASGFEMGKHPSINAKQFLKCTGSSAAKAYTTELGKLITRLMREHGDLDSDERVVVSQQKGMLYLKRVYR